MTDLDTTMRPPPGETGPCMYPFCQGRAYLGSNRCPRHGGRTVPRMPAITQELLDLCKEPLP